MFYAVNHTLHSLHTVRANSSTEAMLQNRQAKNGRRVFFVKQVRYSAFETPKEAKDFQSVLMLDGTQG